MKRTALFFFGTRPEAIKFAPVIHLFKQNGLFNVITCVSGQHREMLDQILHFFDIVPEFDFNLMRHNQSLLELSSSILKELNTVFDLVNPDFIFVQGDTVTAFSGALAGFYRHIPVVHLEAGLRSHHRFSPYPEEMNRLLTDHVAAYHFCPTVRAQENLHRENIRENTWVVGNSVIDALHLGLAKIATTSPDTFVQFFEKYGISFAKKIVLVTGHRRESIGAPFDSICEAILSLSLSYPDLQFVYPVHLNPNIQKSVLKILSNKANIFLLPVLNYPEFIWLLQHAYFVMTDSGGVQEEAPSLGKPLLILRDTTERTEGIDAGTAILTSTDKDAIVTQASQLIENPSLYAKMSDAINPYGSGHTADSVHTILSAVLGLPHTDLKKLIHFS